MIEFILFIYFAINTLYVLTLSVAGWAYKRKPLPVANSYKKIAVLVPAYKEDAVIISTVRHMLQLNYPKKYYDVVVIADRLKEETMDILKTLDVIIVPIFLKKSNKSKSMNYCFEQLPDNYYDIAVISDADNIPTQNFLSDVNNAYQAGHHVIQAQRVAKNTDTPVALLDAISETINNHLFRQGAGAVGLSPSLIGSAMAFDYKLIKQELAGIDSVSEDKVLQLNLIEKGYKVFYLKGTLVFDEKVSTPDAYKNQRRRWMAGQFNQVRYNFLKGIKMLFKGNVDYFHFAVWYNLLPSRILSLMALFPLSLLFTILYSDQIGIILRWWTITLVYVGALLVAVPQSFFTRKLYEAVINLPVIIWKTIEAVLKLRHADRVFIHTEHKTTEVDSAFYQHHQQQ